MLFCHPREDQVSGETARLADRGRIKYLLLLYIECIINWYRFIRRVHDGLELEASLGFSENPFSEAVGLHSVHTEYIFFSRSRLTRSPVHSNFEDGRLFSGFGYRTVREERRIPSMESAAPFRRETFHV